MGAVAVTKKAEGGSVTPFHGQSDKIGNWTGASGISKRKGNGLTERARILSRGTQAGRGDMDQRRGGLHLRGGSRAPSSKGEEGEGPECLTGRTITRSLLGGSSQRCRLLASEKKIRCKGNGGRALEPKKVKTEAAREIPS